MFPGNNYIPTPQLFNSPILIQGSVHSILYEKPQIMDNANIKSPSCPSQIFLTLKCMYVCMIKLQMENSINPHR